VGFDLYAKRKRPEKGGYFRATMDYMTFLRAAMIEAGVPERLVYRKFVGNDGQLVTALQSKAIAERLTVWLQGRNLVIDLVERDGSARATNDAMFELMRELSTGSRAKKQWAARRRAKSLPSKVDRKARKSIRELRGQRRVPGLLTRPGASIGCAGCFRVTFDCAPPRSGLKGLLSGKLGVLLVAAGHAGRSFNGRTRGSEPRYRGSNPCLPANPIPFTASTYSTP
jgi:hypothetical protein